MLRSPSEHAWNRSAESIILKEREIEKGDEREWWCVCVVSWDFEEAQVSFSRDALDQSGRALPKIYLSQKRKSSNRSRFDRIISPSVTHTLG